MNKAAKWWQLLLGSLLISITMLPIAFAGNSATGSGARTRFGIPYGPGSVDVFGTVTANGTSTALQFIATNTVLPGLIVQPSGLNLSGNNLACGNVSAGISVCNESGTFSVYSGNTRRLLVNPGSVFTITDPTSSLVASGSNAFGAAVNGARIDFGAGASDYASSDGTSVTFAGPVIAGGITTPNAVSVNFGTGNTVNMAANAVFRMGASSNQVVMQNTSPTISSGFGSSPSIATQNGTAAFTINVGTGGSATAGVIGLPTAINGWVCNCADITTPGANITRMTATSTTTCTITNVAMSTGLAAAWTASDILHCSAVGR